ncbi:hypothetical protein [Burkholderia vietnamiensis]|uniref:hypothetical protein n=1 Tax=Burkholderia vietnamiensis TaxID=60552 RepID=UPI0012DAA933|nr:hypothetical protein [Burkholderia vietnamiensis]
MIIYRVETETGRGPYNGGPASQYDYTPRHEAPEPYSDVGLSDAWKAIDLSKQKKFYFGFANPAQLLEWFHSDNFHAKAEAQGYRVSVIETGHGEVFHGTYQSIFERSKSVVTQRLTFSQIKQLA